MNDQQRIETAADNCEVLRARLAKYEDADGNPKAQPSGVDERAAFEAWYLGHFYMGDKHCGLEWLSTEPCGGYRHQHPAEQWIVWQARAALSAPSHSEQVREGWMVSLMGPDEVVRIQRKDGKWCGVTHLSESPRDRLLYEFLRTIAAPSAGSQKEQGE